MSIDEQGGLHVPVKPDEVFLCQKHNVEKRCYWIKRTSRKLGGEWRYVCQRCEYERKVARNNQPGHSNTARPPKPDETRYCNVCNHKLNCGWHKDSRCKAGGTWVYRCTKCLRDRQKEINPEYEIDRRRRQAHGITRLQYKALLLSQGGVCAICKRIPPKGLYVDHNHTTGQRRSLLCQHCNSALGFASDDPERLRSMAEYLEHWQAQESEKNNVTA